MRQIWRFVQKILYFSTLEIASIDNEATAIHTPALKFIFSTISYTAQGIHFQAFGARGFGKRAISLSEFGARGFGKRIPSMSEFGARGFGKRSMSDDGDDSNELGIATLFGKRTPSLAEFGARGFGRK